MSLIRTYRDYAVSVGDGAAFTQPLELQEESTGPMSAVRSPLDDAAPTSGALVFSRPVYGISFAPRTRVSECFVEVDGGSKQRLLLGDVLVFPTGATAFVFTPPAWIAAANAWGIAGSPRTAPELPPGAGRAGVRVYYDREAIPQSAPTEFSAPPLRDYQAVDAVQDRLVYYIMTAPAGVAQVELRIQAFDKTLKTQLSSEARDWDGVLVGTVAVNLALAAQVVGAAAARVFRATTPIQRILSLDVSHDVAAENGGDASVGWFAMTEPRFQRF